MRRGVVGRWAGSDPKPRGHVLIVEDRDPRRVPPEKGRDVGVINPAPRGLDDVIAVRRLVLYDPEWAVDVNVRATQPPEGRDIRFAQRRQHAFIPGRLRT